MISNIILVLFLWTFSCVSSASRHSVRHDLLDIIQELNSIVERSKPAQNGVYGSSVEDKARRWLTTNDAELGKRSNKLMLFSWNYMTNLTAENAQALSAVDVELTQWISDRVQEVRGLLRKQDDILDPDILRQLEKWIYSQAVPIADDKATISAISQQMATLESYYGNAQVVKNDEVYRIEPELNKLMAESRDYDELLWAWKAWRNATGPRMKPTFIELVKNLNKAARDNGLSDVGVAWRTANYGEDNIIPMVDKLYAEMSPLYAQLHAYVRHKLVLHYGADKVNPTGPIPAHLLGNMWAQTWENIFDLVNPFPEVQSYDVTDSMVNQGYTPEKMFRLADEFFISIGLEPMTSVFWGKSMIVRPDDRPVECHASAEDFLKQDDFRIKMCTEVNMEYLQTIHHEMGHVQYFMQYRNQPTIYRTGANSAFHEAIGDTIALSVMTPDHYRRIGLLNETSERKSHHSQTLGSDCYTNNLSCTDDEKRELNQLMATALTKIAFIPFGYLIDKWRWDVFNGHVTPDTYNAKWWEYRIMYQGVSPPVERTEDDFDPGAKYHVPAFVPYIRYFLSYIGQFQFHQALCDASGHMGALTHCDIFQSRQAGDLLRSVLELGASKPWQDAMEQFTGQREFSTVAIKNYFSPLYNWLRRYNAVNSIPVGWDST